MTARERVIYLVCADAALTQRLVNDLVATGRHYQLPLAASVAQARKSLRRVTASAILLDESAVASDGEAESLESAVARLTECAPVVVVAAPEHQAALAFLITSGAVDFVSRVGDFSPVAVALLERWTLLAEGSVGLVGGEPGSDFGEVLRHEVNNPLTGILGNAELLLAECKKKRGEWQPSAAALQRLQTIAELAIRLRETVRRLSNAWESRHDHVRSA